MTPSKRYKLFLEFKELGRGRLNWNPYPVKRIYIPKGDGRERPIGIPTIKDRVVKNVIQHSLEPEWEAKFEASSYGFRPGRSVNDAISRINRILMTNPPIFVGKNQGFFPKDKTWHSFE